MKDRPPDECEYLGHPNKKFPPSAFARHEFGWEHVAQETRHLSDGRLIFEDTDADIDEDTAS